MLRDSSFRQSVEDVIESHKSDINGLNPSEIPALRRIHGLNKLEAEPKPHIAFRYIEQYKDPLILMLLGSAFLSIIVGQYEDAISIAMAVLIVGTVAFIQEYRSEQSLEALNTLVPPRCNVLRTGRNSNILAEDLVPGDIVLLQSGDRVPADLRILRTSGLFADESCLTGESEPREKFSNALPHLPEDASISEKSNMLFMGSLVSTGNATAVVVSTAVRTEFGKTFQEMKEIENRRTPLQTKMDELGNKLSVFSLGIIACIGALGMLQGKTFLAMFNIGVSLAVAAIPEGLPICVTVTLALGVLRMAKRNAIVKKLPAVEALGCANFICADKTGTLTQNKMLALRVFCPTLEDAIVLGSSPSELSAAIAAVAVGVGATSLSPKGAEADSFDSGSSAPSGLSPSSSSSSNGSGGSNNRLLFPAAYTQPSLTSAVTYNGQYIDVHKFPCVLQLFDAACLCNNTYLAAGNDHVGQPTESALLVAARRLGIPDRRSSMKRVAEVNFTSDTKFMEVKCRGDGRAEISYLKGALEAILPQCTMFLALNNELMPLTKTAQEKIMQQNLLMSRDGLRVLAVASGTQAQAYTFCGLVGLSDPLRDGVPEAVRRIQDSGARVMMITGDAESTAVTIARHAGILGDGPSPSSGSHRVISGRDIEELVRAGSGSEDALAAIIEDVAVCFRTSPRHKLYIVRALQQKGHVVAMTGDGVNDAPALKAADIGVAVGSGTDVAKEAADMIILDDEFATIVNAIEEGKSIFYNIKNFLTFQLSTSIAALSLVAVNNLVGRPNPLNPMQILWLNIIMDGPLAQSLGVEVVDPAVMARPPRKKTDDIITRPLVLRVLTSGLLILVCTMYVFMHEMEDNIDTAEGKGTGAKVVTPRDLTMTFMTFIMMDLFNALACRHNSRPVWEISATSNKAFLAAGAFSLGGQLLVVYSPPLQKVFRTVSLSFEDMAFVLSLAASMLVLDSARKRYFPSVFTEGGGAPAKPGVQQKGWGLGSGLGSVAHYLKIPSMLKTAKKLDANTKDDKESFTV